MILRGTHWVRNFPFIKCDFLDQDRIVKGAFSRNVGKISSHPMPWHAVVKKERLSSSIYTCGYILLCSAAVSSDIFLFQRVRTVAVPLCTLGNTFYRNVCMTTLLPTSLNQYSGTFAWFVFAIVRAKLAI